MSYRRNSPSHFDVHHFLAGIGESAAHAGAPGGGLAVLRWLWRPPADRTSSWSANVRARHSLPPSPLPERSTPVPDAGTRGEETPWLFPSRHELLPVELQASPVLPSLAG